MLKFIDISYDKLKNISSQDLYRLRKKVFFDRLGWDVICQNDMEFDEYDKPGAQYILGICNDELICSVRFVMLKQANMITHTFNTCFNDVDLPLHGIESSRFFVDKSLSRKHLGGEYPVSHALFLAMINFTRNLNLDGIHTIVSHAMFIIIKRSKWNVKLIKKARLTDTESIYLIFLPSENDSQYNMVKRVQAKLSVQASTLCEWPFSLPINKLS